MNDMVEKLLFVLLLSMIHSFVMAQTVITGSVKNMRGESIFATVILQQTDSTGILGYTVTDDEGNYTIKYDGTDDSLFVIVRSVLAPKTTRRVLNRTARVDFLIAEQENQLKEVTILADPVRRQGDTLSYIVGSFKEQNDRTIEDVLKKLPGVDVSSSGAISYNGKPINKFYIEDLDMLEGRYNLASRNIQADDVASVQVYENHQSIKAESIFSDQAAINLKLKDRAKGVWALNTLLGTGYQPFLWKAEPVAMHFAHNRQHISMYKGNNTGYTSEDELMKHYDVGGLPSYSGMLSITTPNVPDVSKKRYTDNLTHIISLNQLVKVKRYELTANVNFFNERLDKEGFSHSTQYLPDGSEPLTVDENVVNTSRENNLDVSLRVQRNETTTYLRNDLNVKSSWNQSNTDVLTRSGNISNLVHQHLNRPYISVGDELKMMRHIRMHSYRLNARVDYNDRPHALWVSPAYYFGDDSLQVLSQEVIQKNMNASLHTSYGMSLGDFSLNYTPKFTANFSKLTSSLKANDRVLWGWAGSDSLTNELWYNKYQVGVEQDYTYNRINKVKIRLTIPTFLLLIDNRDRLSHNTITYMRWMVTPRLMANYSFSPSFKVVLNGLYRRSYGNMSDAYKGYILQSYRNLLRNSSNHLLDTSNGNVMLSLEHRDAIRMLFFNFGGGYQCSQRTLLYGYHYDGIIGTKMTIECPTTAESYRLNVHTSKSFRLWHTKIDAGGDWNKERSELALQGDVLPFHTMNYTTNASLSVSPTDFFNLKYRFGWQSSKQWVDKHANEAIYLNSHTHQAEVWIYPTKQISIKLDADYQRDNYAGRNNTAFADAMIRYSHKKMECELEGNNLFNAKRYVSTIYSGMGTFINYYELRPINFLLTVRFKVL